MNGIRPTIFVVQFFSRKENLIVTLVIHSYIIRTSDKVPHVEPKNHKTIVIDNDSN